MAQEGELVPVRRIKGRSVELDTANREVLKPRGNAGLRLRPATKVSATDLELQGFQAERCFSPAADPSRTRLQDQVELQEYAAAQASAAEAGLRSTAMLGTAGGRQGGDELSAEGMDLMNREAMAAFSANQQQQGKLWTEASQRNDSSRTRAGKPDYDAVRVVFKVSAPMVVRDLQALVVLRLSKAGEFADLSFTQGIGDVGPQERQIDILRQGIPPDYEIKDARVHLFAQTEELPTNLSEKRYAVTQEEAREYLRLVHLDRHRGETVPAELAWSLAPPALLQLEDGRSLDFPLQVEVDAGGRVTEVKDSPMIVPPQVREVLPQLVFVPALRDGVPVASTVTVNLASFFE